MWCPKDSVIIQEASSTRCKFLQSFSIAEPRTLDPHLCEVFIICSEWTVLVYSTSSHVSITPILIQVPIKLPRIQGLFSVTCSETTVWSIILDKNSKSISYINISILEFKVNDRVCEGKACFQHSNLQGYQKLYNCFSFDVMELSF